MAHYSSKIGDPKTHHLYLMFESGEFSDFKIVYGGVEFKVHKCVLSTGNQYFPKMLQWKNSDYCAISLLESTTFDAFRTLLRYLYTGLIEKESLSTFNVQLYELSTYFQVESLTNLILAELRNILTLDNASLFLGPLYHGNEALAKELVRFIALNSYDLAKKKFPFDLLSPEILTEVFIHLAESDTIRVKLKVGDRVEFTTSEGIWQNGTIIGVENKDIYRVGWGSEYLRLVRCQLRLKDQNF